MTTDLDELLRRALDDIVNATGDLGPCPTVDDVHFRRLVTRVEVRRPQPQGHAGRTSTPNTRRWAVIAAGLLVAVSAVAVAWVAQRPDATTIASGGMDLGLVDGFARGSVTTIDDPPLFVVNDISTGITVFDARSPQRGCVLVLNTNDLDLTVRVPDPAVRFVDPCHGSLFDRAGNKLAGPAPRSLDTYPVMIEDQRVLVDLSHPTPGDPATTPIYSGEDLDTSLPMVGGAWAESMDFSLAPDTNARIYNTNQAAIADCMATRGFDDYEPIPYPPNAGFQDVVSPLDRRYATVMGYHELPAEPDDPNTYTDDTYSALGGSDGCGNTAYADAFDRISSYVNLNDQLRSGLSAAIAGFPDSAVGRAATSQWAACMAERDHPYRSRSDAMNAYVDRPTISANEIATRLDDLDCDLAVGYTRAQHDWERTQIDAWRLDQRDAIDFALEQKQLVDQQLAEIEADQSEVGE